MGFQAGYLELINQHESICQELVRVLLEAMASKAGFGDSERISLYGHTGTNFQLAGRYSKHPEYAKAGDRHTPMTRDALEARGAKALALQTTFQIQSAIRRSGATSWRSSGKSRSG